jgi:hypothetical protein
MAVVLFDMKELLSAPLKKSPSAMVRVCDQYLPVKAGGQTKGLLRVITYLEDMGEVSNGKNPASTGGADLS